MYTYRVKVRKRTYLWGGAGALAELRSPLYLVFRVDDTGERVRFGISRRDGVAADQPRGALEAGETFCVALTDLVGVYAECDHDTYVTCTVMAAKA
jgi:hypothetical protein